MSYKIIQKADLNTRNIEIIFDKSFVLSANSEKILVSGISELIRGSESKEYHSKMGIVDLKNTFPMLMRDYNGWYKINERPRFIERVTRSDAESIQWYKKLFISNLIRDNKNSDIDNAVLIIIRNQGLHIYQE